VIAYLDLIVAFWIVEGGELVCNLALEIESRHLIAHEVGPIIRDDGVRKSKVTHDILPEELNNLLSCDIKERCCFHLFSKVVCGH